MWTRCCCRPRATQDARVGARHRWERSRSLCSPLTLRPTPSHGNNLAPEVGWAPPHAVGSRPAHVTGLAALLSGDSHARRHARTSPLSRPPSQRPRTRPARATRAPDGRRRADGPLEATPRPACRDAALATPRTELTDRRLSDASTLPERIGRARPCPGSPFRVKKTRAAGRPGTSRPRPGSRRRHQRRRSRFSWASSFPCRAAKRYQRIASTRSRGTPRPVSYSLPRLFWPRASPCSAERRNQDTAAS